MKTAEESIGVGTFWLSRVLFLRFLGALYALAFTIALQQNGALIGDKGLLPATRFLQRSHAEHPHSSTWQMYLKQPTIFHWIEPHDKALNATAAVGLALSVFVALHGGANFFIMAVLWLLYHSIVAVGQRWYGFGWESQLLEIGFLALWLVPFVSLRRFEAAAPPPAVCIWGYRWLIMRIMVGAGLIKWRGDPCWKQLTCMNYFFETQMVPNPVAWYLHCKMPAAYHKVEVAANHLVELVFPYLLLCCRTACAWGGAAQIVFQAAIIIGGNLAFLNWLTILPCVWCYDDAHLKWMFSSKTLAQAAAAAKAAAAAQQQCSSGLTLAAAACWLRRLVHAAVFALLVRRSVPVVRNLISPGQVMNASLGDPWRIVNTYGAFGTVTKKRYEVILKGTTDTKLGPNTRWIEYQLKAKPGDINRRPALITPYHYRLDWLFWFLSLGSYNAHHWFVSLVSKLLSPDATQRNTALSLLAGDPFHGQAPAYIKADLYSYAFTRPEDLHKAAAAAAAVPQVCSSGTGTSNSADAPAANADASSGGSHSGSKSLSGSSSSGGGGSSSSGSGSSGSSSSDAPAGGAAVEYGRWWTRRFSRPFLPPVAADNASVAQFLAQFGLS